MVRGDARFAEPVTVDQPSAAQAVMSGCASRHDAPSKAAMISAVLRLRADADDVDAHLLHFRDFGEQVVGLRRHRLDAVDRQKGWPSRVFVSSPRVFQALELAVVLVQPVMARGEAACREGQRQLAVDEDLGLDAFRSVGVQRFDQRAVGFQRRYPAASRSGGRYSASRRCRC